MSKRPAPAGVKGAPMLDAGQVDTNTRTILSVLRTYPSYEVAIIGCHASLIARTSCEYDLLVVSKDPTPPKHVRTGESFAEIFFRSEKELREPTPELAATLAKAKVLRDNTLLLGSAVANAKRRFKESCMRAAELHLASALKALGRVDEKVSQNLAEADFWLTAAASDLCFSEIYFSQQLPSPSHLFSQMKALSRRKSASFKEWSEASGFKLASRASCENRLEALSVLYDVMRTTKMDMAMALKLGRYRSDDAIAIVRAKATELLRSQETIECYSFLSFDVVKTLLDLYSMHCYSLRKEPDYGDVIGDLTVGPKRLISAELIKGMSIVRPAELVKAGADALRVAVSALATKM